jgi:hypothetical protein
MLFIEINQTETCDDDERSCPNAFKVGKNFAFSYSDKLFVHLCITTVLIQRCTVGGSVKKKPFACRVKTSRNNFTVQLGRKVRRRFQVESHCSLMIDILQHL